MPESTPLQPGQKFGNGRFVLVRALGRGGMGEVWLAQDERLLEPVALKFLPSEIRGDPVALDDLRRETVRSHKLTHPNIVRIHDLHEDPDGTAFIVMEYVDGPTLAALRLEQPNRVFAWSFLRPLLEQLCAALAYAHGEKVIHRDLKPANMMVDSRGRLKLADFGIAAVASDSISRVSAQGPTSGTLLYMSPQQLAGKRAQVTDDIYALGATLYELLTSKPPFYTGDLTHQVLHEAPEPLAERWAALAIQNAIPADVAAIIMACLAKEPGQRPQSAQAVAEWIGFEVDAIPADERPLEAAAPQLRSNPAASRMSWRLVIGMIAGLLIAGAVFFYALRKRPPDGTYTTLPVTNSASQTEATTIGPARTKKQRGLDNMLFKTGFEAEEGYVADQPLIGQRGWYRGGWSEQMPDGGQGIGENLFSGSLQQAFVGGLTGATKPTVHIGVGRNLRYSPAPNESGIVEINWRQMIIDSTSGPRNCFEWDFYARNGHMLCGLLFDNANLKITRRHADNSLHGTPLTFARGQVYTVKLKFNFVQNTWEAAIDNDTMPAQPILAGSTTPTLGTVFVTWWSYSKAAHPGDTVTGNNRMAFDDLVVSILQ